MATTLRGGFLNLHSSATEFLGYRRYRCADQRKPVHFCLSDTLGPDKDQVPSLVSS